MERDIVPDKEDLEPKHDAVFEFKLELQQNVTKAQTLYVTLYGMSLAEGRSCRSFHIELYEG